MFFRDFLTGFSKRKLQRKKKAEDEFQSKLKVEQKKLREESKDLKTKLKQSFAPIEELKDLLSDEEQTEVFETEDATVTISALSTEDIAKKKNFIGYRSILAESDSEPEEAPLVQFDTVPGMEIDEDRINKRENRPDEEIQKLTSKLKSDKDLKKLLKQKSKEALKKSQAIKMRDKLNNKRNLKLAARKKNVKEKFLRKHKKLPSQKGARKHRS